MSNAILVTRPQGQHQQMMTLLREQGYQPEHCSALQITPVVQSDSQRQALLNLDQFHAVIFISGNAAQFGLMAMSDYWPQWPVGVNWLAVGPSTAAILEQQQMPVQMPVSRFDSEGLLALPCLQDLFERKVLIIAGEGGRGYLAQTLSERGAQVQTLALYRRGPNPAFVWPDKPVDAVLITSAESWQAIEGRVPEQCLCVVPSERVAAAVKASVKQPHSHIAVAASARDEDMLLALQQALPVSG